MGKYEPLSRYLQNVPSESIDASFAQIESILGFPLPQSAFRHQAWWANESHGSHSHARSWQDAGWETCQVNRGRRTIRFERRKRKQQTESRAPKMLVTNEALLQKAIAISGITDQDKVVEAALTAFIEREAGRTLIELGGTLPDAWVPERERPAT